MTGMPSLTVTAITGLPEVVEGDDVAALILAAMAGGGLTLHVGDALVVSSKIVSKSLGLVVRDADRESVVQAQSVRVVAERRGGERVTRIVEAAAGPVMAAAGVDASNVGVGAASSGPDGTDADSGEDADLEHLLVLPRDSDAEAARLRGDLLAATAMASGAALAVVVSDTAGRPWREGLTDFALGCSGLRVVDDLRGGTDHDGRPLAVTVRALADELAAAADLVKGKADGIPVALVRGLPLAWFAADAQGARTLLRRGPSDWFRFGHVEAVRAALGAAPGSTASHGVGIPAIGPEELAVRIGRAVALALLDSDSGAADVEVSGVSGVVELQAADDVELGRLVARLEVAGASEDLRVVLTAHAPGMLRCELTDRP